MQRYKVESGATSGKHASTNNVSIPAFVNTIDIDVGAELVLFRHVVDKSKEAMGKLGSRSMDSPTQKHKHG